MPDISVFISHSWKYSEHYEKLFEWVFKNKWQSQGTKIVFLDTSVPKDNPIHFAKSDRELKRAIWERIQIADVVVIPTGMYANYSKWIAKEIEGAQKYKKPILAVNPWNQERKSSVVQQASEDYCGWNKQSVVGKIWSIYQKRRRVRII